MINRINTGICENQYQGLITYTPFRQISCLAKKVYALILRLFEKVKNYFIAPPPKKSVDVQVKPKEGTLLDTYLPLNKFSKNTFIYAAVGAMANVIAGQALLHLASYFKIEIPKQAIANALMKNQFPRHLLISVCLTSPILEEILFRGVLTDLYSLIDPMRENFRKFKPNNCSIVSIAAVSYLFGVGHKEPTFSSMQNRMVALDTFIGGTIYGYLRMKTGNLWSSVIAHSINNLSVTASLYYLGRYTLFAS